MKKIVYILMVAMLFSVSASAQEFGGSDNGGSESNTQFGGSDLGENSDNGVEFGGSDLGGNSDNDDNGSSNDGGNNNSGSRSGSSRGNRIPSEPTVLGASTGPNGQTLSCAPYVIGFSGLGKVNNPAEVAKLQSFLNEFMGENLAVTGVFGNETFEAVKRLQAKYSAEILKPWDDAGLSVNLQPTGYAYIMTRWFVNTQMCKLSGVTFPKPDLRKEVGL